MTQTFAVRPFGTSLGEVAHKRFNIFIGISLGNKFLNTERAKNYLEYAIDHTRESVLVLIADQIDTTNWIIYNRFSEEAAEQKVAQKGSNVEHIFKRALVQLSRGRGTDFGRRVEIIRWKSVVRDEVYQSSYRELQKNFMRNSS